MTNQRQRREALERCIIACYISDGIRRAPVGQAVQRMPQEVRDILKELKSDDIATLRPDAIYV